MEIFNTLFYRIFIVTNQAGIEKGLLSHEQLQSIHEQMLEFIQYHGGRVDEIYYCPFTAGTDPLCRKPNPGMALEAAREFPDIQFTRSLMVGDSDSDIAFGNRLGMKTILVGDKPDNHFSMPDALPDTRMSSLLDVAKYFQALT
jgi:histidinol-phosphate phosphatase family protein